MKKFGQFCLCFVPMIAMLAINVGVTMVAEIIAIAKFLTANGVEAMADGRYYDYVMGLASDSDFVLSVTVIFQIVCLITAALVYYFGFKEKKIGNPVKQIGGCGVGVIVLLIVGLELILTLLLMKAYDWFPAIMEDYQEMVESSGLGDMTVLSTIATLVLAPIAEELVFRGMTFKLARKFTANFWIANIIQAACFGIAHLNLVQGLYVFCFALVLGYIYRKYDSIYASMLAHLVFNFSGTYLVNMIFGNDESLELIKGLIVLFVAVIFLVAALLLLSKDQKALENEKHFFARYAAERLPKVQYVPVQPDQPMNGGWQQPGPQAPVYGNPGPGPANADPAAPTQPVIPNNFPGDQTGSQGQS